MEPLVAALQAGRPARTAIPPGEAEAVRRLQLMTSKPVLYVCNVEEAAAATGNAQSAARGGDGAGGGGGLRRGVRRDRGRGEPRCRRRTGRSSWPGWACRIAGWTG